LRTGKREIALLAGVYHQGEGGAIL
jgi:hypothetical protein